jgi:CO dehydrogenase maturation factor
VGKTTIAALLLTWLVDRKHTPVLAIDADSNANLHELLGFPVHATVGGIREEARSAAKALSGIAKHQFLELQVHQAVVEQPGYDFLAMGRPEGPGCYCFANSVLRDVIERLASSYRFLVIDCEAGLEHLSRRTILSIDYLFTISDPTVRGLHTALRIGEVLDEMKTRVRSRGLIVNRVPQGYELSAGQQREFTEHNFEVMHTVPHDESVTRIDEQGLPIGSLPPDSPAAMAVDDLMKRLIG